MSNDKCQITNESRSFVMGWMNPAHLRWKWASAHDYRTQKGSPT